MSKYSERFNSRFGTPEDEPIVITNIQAHRSGGLARHLWKVGLVVIVASFLFGFIPAGQGLGNDAALSQGIEMFFFGLALVAGSFLLFWGRKNAESDGQWNRNAGTAAKIFFSAYLAGRITYAVGTKVASKVYHDITRD
jgi:hypothetical protein